MKLQALESLRVPAPNWEIQQINESLKELKLKGNTGVSLMSGT